MVGWLVGRLLGWLVGWLVGWLARVWLRGIDVSSFSCSVVRSVHSSKCRWRLPRKVEQSPNDSREIGWRVFVVGDWFICLHIPATRRTLLPSSHVWFMINVGAPEGLKYTPSARTPCCCFVRHLPSFVRVDLSTLSTVGERANQNKRTTHQPKKLNQPRHSPLMRPTPTHKGYFH